MKANLHALALTVLALALTVLAILALGMALLVGVMPRGERYPVVKEMRPCRAVVDGSPFVFCGRLSDGTVVVTNKWREP